MTKVLTTVDLMAARKVLQMVVRLVASSEMTMAQLPAVAMVAVLVRQKAAMWEISKDWHWVESMVCPMVDTMVADLAIQTGDEKVDSLE